MMLSWEQSTEPRDRHRTVLAPRSATLNTSIHRRQTLYRRGLRYIDERSHLLHISHIMITPYRPKPVFFSVLFKPISAMCKTVSNASCVMQNSWTDRRPVCGEDFWGPQDRCPEPLRRREGDRGNFAHCKKGEVFDAVFVKLLWPFGTKT